MFPLASANRNPRTPSHIEREFDWTDLDLANAAHYARMSGEYQTALRERDAAWREHVRICDLFEAGAATHADIERALHAAQRADLRVREMHAEGASDVWPNRAHLEDVL